MKQYLAGAPVWAGGAGTQSGQNTDGGAEPARRCRAKKGWENMAKKVSRVGTELGLAGIIALSPYVSGKAQAQIWDRHPDYTLNVQQDCADFSGEGECFESVRDAVLEGNNALVRDFDMIEIANKFSEIKVAEGDFAGENVFVSYSVLISGNGTENTNLNDFNVEVMEATNRVNGIWLDNLTLNNSNLIFLSEGEKNNKSLRFSSGAIDNCVLDRTTVNMFANSYVEMRNNTFVLGDSKDGVVGGIRVNNPYTTNPRDVEVTLRTFGNQFIGGGIGPAISVASGVTVLPITIDEPQGLNTFYDCNPLVVHEGGGTVDLSGNFIAGGDKVQEAQKRFKGVGGDGVVEDNASRTPKDLLETHLKEAETYGPPAGTFYVDEAALRASGLILGNAGNNVMLDNLQYVNPHEVSPVTLPGYEGMTNLAHYLATGGDGGGFIGINSGYGRFGYLGKRTWEDVDGDGVKNHQDEDPYNPNIPDMMPDGTGVPVYSPLGLLGGAIAVGLAGVYGLRRRRARDLRKQP